MNTGDKIRILREQAGFTLDELGKRVGVGKSTVRKWETGFIANMGRDKIAKLSEVFGVSPTYLISEDDSELEKTPVTSSDRLSIDESKITDKDKRFLEWFHSLSPEKQRAILIAQDAPEDLL